MTRERRLGLSHWATLFISNILILLTISISLVVLCFRCLHAAKKIRLTLDNEDVLLVLGVQLIDNEVPPDFQLRLDKTLELLRYNPNLQVILSGGITAKATCSEAQKGKEFLVENGVVESRIILEAKSQHSIENISHSKNIIEKQGYENVAIVTNRYHLLRVSMIAKSVGLDSTTFAAEQQFLYTRKNTLRIMVESWTIHWHLTHIFLRNIVQLRWKRL